MFDSIKKHLSFNSSSEDNSVNFCKTEFIGETNNGKLFKVVNNLGEEFQTEIKSISRLFGENNKNN